jgi:hypothetical protein
MKAKQQFIPLKRPRFFSGQLLSASDLEAEQRYVLEKQKRHNRGLHGYGVVSGLDVSVKNDDVNIDLNIDDGMAIDALGNEIVVPGCVQISLKRTGRVAYVMVRYREHETDPVPVQSDSNGGAQFSRVEEGFEITISSTQEFSSAKAKDTVENQNESGVVLARLVLRRGRWQVDRKFRRPKTR